MDLNVLKNDGKSLVLSGFDKIQDVITIKKFGKSIVIIPGPMREIANRRVFFINDHSSDDPELIELVTECCGIGETQFLEKDGAYYQIH